MTMNREAFEVLLRDDIQAVLREMSPSADRSHVIAVLESSGHAYYGTTAARLAWVNELVDEVSFAIVNHGKFASAHEGYAVMLEELDEVWDIVKLKREARDEQQLRRELLQLAAMAIKMLLNAHEFCAGPLTR